MQSGLFSLSKNGIDIHCPVGYPVSKRLTPEVRGQSDENTNDLNAIQPVNILNGEEAQLIRDSYEHSTAF